MMPAIHEFADGGLHEPGQIPGDVGGVFAGQLHLAAEGEVVAAKNRRAGHNAGREGLVVTVPQAEDPAVILVGFAALDLHEAEVAQSFVAQAVRLGADDEAVGLEGAFDLGDQFAVWDWRPGVGGARRRDTLNVITIDGPGAAVEQQVRARALDVWWLMIE